MSTLTSHPTPNPFRQSRIFAAAAPRSNFLEQLGSGAKGLTATPESEASYSDSSSTLFSLYLSHAEKYDKDQAESWKAGADGILVFTGLFAAAIATFVIDSYKSLLPDSAGNTVVLLAQISRQLDGLSNGTHVPITAPLTSLSSRSSAQQSSAPASAVWVNSLWFLSLVVSLFCALLATLQQRWARRYIQLTQPKLAVHKRAHIRSFFAEGVAHFHMHLTVEAIPALLHISVFLFLAGLIISLFTIHHTVAYIILSAIVVCTLVYTAITVLPVIYHDSPYTTPFSSLAWYVSRKMAVAVLKAVDCVTNFLKESKGGFARWRSATKTTTTTPPQNKVSSHKPLLDENMNKAVYKAAIRSNAERDARALGWTLDQLDEEGELVQFAAGIPGFSRSTVVKEPIAILEKTPALSRLHGNLYRHIMTLLIRAFKPGLLRDSKLLPESVREQRVAICLEAMYYLPHGIEKILERLADHYHNRAVADGFAPLHQSVESWLVAERLSTTTTSRIDRAVKIAARCMATVIANRPPQDERARPILMRHSKIKDPHVFNQYVDRFDNLLLKNLDDFLTDIALGVVSDVDRQHHINLVILTVRLAKRLKFEHVSPNLREQFEKQRTKIQQYATGPPGKARENAEKLLLELSSLTTDPPRPPVPVPPASGNAPRARTWPTDALGAAAALAPTHPPQTSQSSSVGLPLQPVSQPNDAYISMALSPTAQNDTFPMTSMSPSSSL